VIIVFVLVQSLLGKEGERDHLAELVANAVAAFGSSVVAISVSPAYRWRVAVVWVVCILLVACYGNLIAGFINWSISMKNILVITAGSAFGCLAARAWLNERWE
jgi:hypothetical protein